MSTKNTIAVVVLFLLTQLGAYCLVTGKFATKYDSDNIYYQGVDIPEYID